MKILILEINDSKGFYIQQTREKLGHDVFVACDIKEAQKIRKDNEMYVVAETLKQDRLEKLTVIPKPFPFNEGSLRKCDLLAQVKRISKLQEPAVRYR